MPIIITFTQVQGVVKKIMPAIGATNAAIAAVSCNEAFKFFFKCGRTQQQTIPPSSPWHARKTGSDDPSEPFANTKFKLVGGKDKVGGRCERACTCQRFACGCSCKHVTFCCKFAFDFVAAEEECEACREIRHRCVLQSACGGCRVWWLSCEVVYVGCGAWLLLSLWVCGFIACAVLVLSVSRWCAQRRSLFVV